MEVGVYLACPEATQFRDPNAGRFAPAPPPTGRPVRLC
jgi:hypothetical protein